MEKEVLSAIKTQSNNFNFDKNVIVSFISCESGGKGFDEETGKILIQFEPASFKKKAPYAPSGLWSVNKVERQRAEWKAFNDAFAKNPTAAMESTSIGLGQIMGFHWKRLGYKSVGEMWDDAKKGIDRQIWQICQFILTDPQLQDAINSRNFDKIAFIYNGTKYKELAKKYGRVPYNIEMKNTFIKYSSRVW